MKFSAQFSALYPAFTAFFQFPLTKAAKKAIAATLVFLFLGIVTGFGWVFYQERQIVTNVRPALKLSALHVSSLLECKVSALGMPEDSCFEKSESAIADIESRIAEIRGLAQTGYATLYYDSVKQMQTSEALIREVSTLYQHVSRMEAAKEQSNHAKSSLKKARGIHDANYRRKNFMELLNESGEELEATRQSRQTIVSILMRMRSNQAVLEKDIGAQYLVDAGLLTKAITRFSIERPASGIPGR